MEDEAPKVDPLNRIFPDPAICTTERVGATKLVGRCRVQPAPVCAYAAPDPNNPKGDGLICCYPEWLKFLGNKPAAAPVEHQRTLPDPAICKTKRFGNVTVCADCMVDHPKECKYARAIGDSYLCGHPDWKTFLDQG